MFAVLAYCSCPCTVLVQACSCNAGGEAGSVLVCRLRLDSPDLMARGGRGGALTTAAVAALAVCVRGKDCVFLHGAGLDTEGPVTETFTSYWGDVHEATPQCDNHYFIHANTVDNACDSALLMAQFCRLALVNSVDNFTASNVIIFTHSMANDILAAAVKNGVCEVASDTATWCVRRAGRSICCVCERGHSFFPYRYEVSGPMSGSKAVALAGKICRHARAGPCVQTSLHASLPALRRPATPPCSTILSAGLLRSCTSATRVTRHSWRPRTRA